MVTKTSMIYKKKEMNKMIFSKNTKKTHFLKQ